MKKKLVLLLTLIMILVNPISVVNASSYQEVPDLTGEWSIIGNGSSGKFNIVIQDGGEFTGTVNIDGANIEKLINGSLSGDTFSFTRMWDSGTLWQDFKGELTISENGVAKITGTFSQTGGGYVYSWTATKINPINSISAVNASSNQEVPDLTGEWSIIGNGFYGKFYVVNQDGGEFTGTVNYNGGNIEKLINGSLSDDIFYFTRMWDSGTLWQDYKGELTISESGVAKITGTFSQTGGGYVYSWTATKVNPINSTIIVETEQEEMTIGKSTAEAFESGARISWVSSNGIGYRLFRSTSNTSLGISVTDFYLTSTSYADVNVNPNTTYYYTVKPVLSEANPYQGKEEKLGATLATFTVKTGESVYKQGSLKNFIMLQLENPYLTMNGVREEIDVGRGTTPIIISGRTMVPIRAVVEAMGGTVGWDDGTQKITLNARGNIVEMWLNKTDIIINGTSMQMDVAPISKNGRTFVPVRFAAENLNCKVDWINSTKEAVIIFED